MITNLELKLNGQKPVTIEELLELVSSWGRSDNFITDHFTTIKKCKPNECYNLSNLDVSQITNFSYVFYRSYYDGDLSKWNISNANDLNRMFAFSDFNNNSISNWNTSNVIDMNYMFFQSNYFNVDINNWNTSKLKYAEKTFSYSSFDGDLSKWNISNLIIAHQMFDHNRNFEKKYNNGMCLPDKSNQIIEWFENNRINMKEKNTSKEEVLDFFSFDNLEKEIVQ